MLDHEPARVSGLTFCEPSKKPYMPQFLLITFLSYFLTTFSLEKHPNKLILLLLSLIDLNRVMLQKQSSWKVLVLSVWQKENWSVGKNYPFVRPDVGYDNSRFFFYTFLEIRSAWHNGFHIGETSVNSNTNKCISKFCCFVFQKSTNLISFSWK